MLKKGEKSLQMIFGLFLLLIISLVVLTLFFKFVQKSGGSMQDITNTYAKQAEIESAKLECETLCEKISDDNTLIDYCSTAFAVDWDEDGITEGPANYGKWWFCEQKIPCFVLNENCKNRYDGNRCREVLNTYRSDLYSNLALNVDGSAPTLLPANPSPTNYQDTYDDGCGLPFNESSESFDGNFPTDYNWKQKFDFI